jgi:anti-anti-sigma regulatory factor
MANFRFSGDTAFIGGDLTVQSGAALQNFLRTLLANQGALAVDLRGVEMWDSSAIQLFLSWIRSRHDEPVVWRNMPHEMINDIQIMGLAKFFSGATNER